MYASRASLSVLVVTWTTCIPGTPASLRSSTTDAPASAFVADWIDIMADSVLGLSGLYLTISRSGAYSAETSIDWADIGIAEDCIT